MTPGEIAQSFACMRAQIDTRTPQAFARAMK